MTREEQLDAALNDCVATLESTKDVVINHPIHARIEATLTRAKAIEFPEKTGTIKKILGDRRDEMRDPGEHDQHVAEELGLAEKAK